MNNFQKLQTWIESEKRKYSLTVYTFPNNLAIRKIFGIVDFPAPSAEDLDAAAWDVLSILDQR